MADKLEVFISYAHADEEWQMRLEKHLSSLKRQKLITSWHDRKIIPGAEWAPEIDIHLKTADIILLLISPDFISSEYCWNVELKRAIKRHKAEDALVIPIIVRPVDWKQTPFAKLQALPSDGKPISLWTNYDEALAYVAQDIRKAIEDLQKKRATARSTHATSTSKGSTVTWNIPFRLNPFFTGRERILTEIHTMLQMKNAAGLPQPLAISGLGGIGKTQIATEYAYRYSHEYQNIFWVQANTYETLISSYVSLAVLLNLPEKEARNQNLAVQAVKTWLEQNSNWLIIFDNADDLSLTDLFLPSRGSGHVILTTRTYVMRGKARRIQVEKMDDKEGILFLLRRSNILAANATLSSLTQDILDTATTIVGILDCLPLALDQAGAYIEETECGLLHYLELYQTRRKELHLRRSNKTPDHPKSVATTWSLSFQNIEEANPAAAELLRFCSFLHPDSIPEELFKQGSQYVSSKLEVIAYDPIKLDEAISELLDYSLVRRISEKKSLAIHPLVQAVLIDQMDSQAQQKWIQQIIQVVQTIFPSVTFETWSLCQQYLPHALKCASYIKERGITTPEAAQLLNQAGSYLDERGQYAEASSLYKHALAIREQILEPSHLDTAASLNNLGGLNESLGNYAEALPLFQRSLAIREHTLGPSHPDTAASLNNLAAFYESQGNYIEALALYQRALEIKQATLGSSHPSTAASLNNLAYLYYNQGNYTKALPLYQQALAIFEQTLGLSHPYTVMIGENIAKLKQSEKEKEKS